MWQIILYPPWADESPIAEAMSDLPNELRGRIEHALTRLAEHGPDVLLSTNSVARIKSEEELFEYRIQGRGAYRILFMRTGRVLVIVHAFPRREWRKGNGHLRLAERRAAEVRERFGRATHGR